LSEVKKKIKDDDFKKLLDLNRERLVQRGILETAIAPKNPELTGLV
jgi:hypothetical protein